MSADIQEYDSLLLSATELQMLRESLVQTIKKIDKVLAGKDIKGKTLADYILNGICAYYKIDRLTLRKLGRNPKMVERRKFAVYILKRYTDRTLQEIADMVGYEQHGTVDHHIKDMEQLLSGEVYGDKEIKATYKKLLKHLNL